ncbi:hypothetical protein E3N88_08827 [Mikania micrantha]|uniref:Uncharacterized protein n=1 Tax=Mikania micrantha TaxID=192012 RepID=A0A5N6PJC0_9ASTR|nr:hypothetical protein E3N88_08827 [Mikania micrantha]
MGSWASRNYLDSTQSTPNAENHFSFIWITGAKRGSRYRGDASGVKELGRDDEPYFKSDLDSTKLFYKDFKSNCCEVFYFQLDYLPVSLLTSDVAMKMQYGKELA